MHVTICIPAFNAEHTLRRTLDSILVQDYPDFDVLVCDNASTDKTAQIVKEYVNRNVRYVLNPDWTPLAERNWNYALGFAAGPLIALYHADDIYTPTMVRRQVEFIQMHPDISAVFTKTRMINDQDRPIRLGTVLQPKELRGQECFAFPILFNAVLKYRNFLTVPTLMTKRAALDGVGAFDLRYRSSADIDLWFRLSQLGSVGVINEPLHYYRISARQWSAQIDRRRTEIADFFRVLDDYLTRPEVVQIVESAPLKYYEVDRAIDSIWCAMNLLVQGDTMKALSRLKEALHWRHFRVACHRPRHLAHLLEGVGLFVMGTLGGGILAGRCSYWAHQMIKKWHSQCID